MRFKTFRTILIGGVAVAGIGGLLAVSTCCKSEPKTDTAAKPTETAKPTATPTPTPIPTPIPTLTQPSDEPIALRPEDQKIIDLFNKPATSDKLKDAVPGAWKVNIYRENGAAKFNRAKIDLNKNEKWDEKWSMDGDVLKRQVAPYDDENYTIEYLLKDGKWVRKRP
jgi:hypothetical protein